MTPLMHASEGGFPEIVTELINKEANINDKNNYGQLLSINSQGVGLGLGR